nr:hypothetical protein [uncultured Methanoregula sp.]
MACILVSLIITIAAGCTAPSQLSEPAQAPRVIVTASPSATILTTPAPALTTAPVPVVTSVTVSANTTPVRIPEAVLNTRIVDARNKLNNLIDSDVSDTIILHPTSLQNCEIKRTRELGYLIDTVTGESMFTKGGYWSIESTFFKDKMRKDRDYIIIHTHPKTWKVCKGSSGVISFNTFSIEDLAAIQSLTKDGFHVRKLIAITDDRDFRIWPKKDDDWKSDSEIRLAEKRIETRLERPFSYYDPILDRQFTDVDNLMPYLAKELNYTYMINNDVIS